jgi:hypothetical protein
MEIIRVSNTRKEAGPTLFGFNPESKVAIKVADERQLQDFFDSHRYPASSPVERRELEPYKVELE